MSQRERRVVPVALGARSYNVHVGEGLLADAGAEIARLAPAARLAVVTDETVAGLHLNALESSLAASGRTFETIVLPPGERTKSFAGLETLCERLLETGLERKDLVVAFGGGVIGDLAGFAAGVLKRGVDFVQIPTTLLAQVDSSVGGKTAIDARAGKNLVGLFHQPRLVLADVALLATLPDRELRAGYAEVVKYGLIDDPAFFAWCEANGGRLLARDLDALVQAVETSVRAKARIVSADEREGGVRALLNLGHTFGHALEASAGFDGALVHGEAVAAGIAMAYAHSARLGLMSQRDADRVALHFHKLGLETAISALPGGPYEVETLMGHMRQDKKSEGGAITLVLARGLGEAFVQKRADEAALRRHWAEALEVAP